MAAAVLPLLILGALVTTLVSRRFDETAQQRLERGLLAAEHRMADLAREATEAVYTIAREDLGDLPGPPEPDLAARLASRRRLTLLELVDGKGVVLSSHHWPAGLGLPSRHEPLGATRLSSTTVGSGHGAAERLAVTASESVVFEGRDALTVRGGYLLDAARLRDLADLLGLEVGIFDAPRQRWVIPDGSPLGAWTATVPIVAHRGEVALPAGVLLFAARPVAPGMSLVVAMPAAPLHAVRREVFTLTAGLSLLAAVAALAAAVVLSGRLARPLRALADRARTLGRGDFEPGEGVGGGEGEVLELTLAFEVMTAELRDARARMVQAERVAAWREMARRLAHELKNPIFPIQLSIETLRRALDGGGSARPDRPSFEALFRESSDTILDELRALRKIVDEFSEFARMPRPRFSPTDVNRVARQVLALYAARAEKVTVVAELSGSLPLVPGDPDLLARALGNLVANAIEAMPEGGTLCVRTEAAPGGVRIGVSDDGPGLTDEQRTRLFTPHYTTKPGGTGLGLAIVQGIVADHGGRVEAASDAVRGTSFALFLPLVRPSVPLTGEDG